MFDKETLTDLTRTLVEWPSQQTDRMEAEPQVQSFIRDCAAPILLRLGLKGRFDDMGNWIGRFGSGSGPSLMIVTYAMTHPAAAMRDPFTATIVDDGGRAALRGRGAAEQKGAMAAAFAAVAALVAGGTAGDITLAVSCAGETGRHDSIKAILGGLDRKPDVAILALGTGTRVSLGNKGRIDFDVIVRGRSAHSGTPWLAVDAIAGARRLLDALAAVELPAREHAALGRATLTPTFIESGPRATHTIQDTVRMTFDRRLLPGEQPEQALAAFRAAVAALPGPHQYELVEGPFMYPAEIAPSGKLATMIATSHAAAGLTPPGTFYSHGALDAGYLIAHGIEATMWGPGAMELFHTEDERVAVDDIVNIARGYHAVGLHGLRGLA